jgi:DNA-binding Lrp family transcriptional regulator
MHPGHRRGQNQRNQLSLYKIQPTTDIGITTIATQGAIFMVSAIILLKVSRERINAVAQELASMRGISEVFSVGGRYDLVAILRVKNNEALAELVTEQMLKVQGILDTETLIAFRAYSEHDLESMFSIGWE